MPSDLFKLIQNNSIGISLKENGRDCLWMMSGRIDRALKRLFLKIRIVISNLIPKVRSFCRGFGPSLSWQINLRQCCSNCVSQNTSAPPKNISKQPWIVRFKQVGSLLILGVPCDKKIFGQHWLKIEILTECSRGKLTTSNNKIIYESAMKIYISWMTSLINDPQKKHKNNSEQKKKENKE